MNGVVYLSDINFLCSLFFLSLASLSLSPLFCSDVLGFCVLFFCAGGSYSVFFIFDVLDCVFFCRALT